MPEEPNAQQTNDTDDAQKPEEPVVLPTTPEELAKAINAGRADLGRQLREQRERADAAEASLTDVSGRLAKLEEDKLTADEKAAKDAERDREERDKRLSDETTRADAAEAKARTLLCGNILRDAGVAAQGGTVARLVALISAEAKTEEEIAAEVEALKSEMPTLFASAPPQRPASSPPGRPAGGQSGDAQSALQVRLKEIQNDATLSRSAKQSAITEAYRAAGSG
jgi:hypothetical protein